MSGNKDIQGASASPTACSPTAEPPVSAGVSSASPLRPAGAEDTADLIRDAWGALNFILAFYEPGQRYLDTEAWKHCEANARAVHARLARALPDPPEAS